MFRTCPYCNISNPLPFLLHCVSRYHVCQFPHVMYAFSYHVAPLSTCAPFCGTSTTVLRGKVLGRVVILVTSKYLLVLTLPHSIFSPAFPPFPTLQLSWLDQKFIACSISSFLKFLFHDNSISFVYLLFVFINQSRETL